VVSEALRKIIKRVSKYFGIILLIIISSAFSYFMAVYNDKFKKFHSFGVHDKTQIWS